MKVIFLILATISNIISAADFVCPKSPITEQVGLTGTLPDGATSQVKVPANTDCKYEFHIPKGFALKIETSAVYDISVNDFVRFDQFYIPSGIDDYDYAVNSPLKYEVNSVTGNLTFFAKYSYIDISNYKQKIVPTGSFFNTTLEANTYYTMQASEGNTATFNLAMLDTGFYDLTLSQVFVFDGNDFMNSEYVGRLQQQLKYFNMHSDTRSFTFLNLYRSPSYSYLLGNDYSKVQNYEQYRVGVLDPVKVTEEYMGNDVNGHPDAYYTFFCDGCDGFYIEYLVFDESRWTDPEGYVEIRGLSPTQDLSPVLKYMYSTDNNASFPQYIPAPMATFYIHKACARIAFKIDSTSSFVNTVPSDKRTVSSANLWNPDSVQDFDYKFQDPLSLSAFNFSITLRSVNLENDDELDVQVSSVDGLTTLDKKFTKTSLSNVPLSGMGSYLNVKYSAKSKNSNVQLDFEMIDPSATTVVPKSSTASSPTTVVSTTVGSTESTASTPGTIVTTPSTVSYSTSATPSASNTVSTASRSTVGSTVAHSISDSTPSTVSYSTSSASSTVITVSSASQSTATSTVGPTVAHSTSDSTSLSTPASQNTKPSTPSTVDYSNPSTITRSTRTAQQSTVSTATVQTTTSGISGRSILLVFIAVLMY